MEKGCCVLPVIPVRETGSHKAQQVNQLLFGDTYSIIEEKGEWLWIKGDFDGYEGFIRRNQHFTGIPEGPRQTLSRNQPVEVHFGGNSWEIMVPAGSYFYGQAFVHGNMEFLLKESSPALSLHETLRQFRFAPYLWGGRTSWGMDCSGLTQIVHKIAGINLPRDAYQQALEGTTIDFDFETQAGDLAFFDNEEGHIHHVGIITQPGIIVHASGFVREDRLDHAGIFDPVAKIYTHKLRIIKRLNL